MNKKYLIGVTPRTHFEKEPFLRIRRNYLDKLTNIDLVPIILTPGKNLETQLALCDGFVLIGGDDINPKMYHQDNHLNLSKDIDNEMDQFDLEIIKYATIHNRPLLGICRGHQSLTGVQGYALHQDIDASHLSHPHEDHFHTVTKVTNFGLATLLPDSFVTNTYHHQATNVLPNEYIVLYRNHDVIEAIQHQTLPFIGIQWHPERMNTPESDIIFNYFKELVQNYDHYH